MYNKLINERYLELFKSQFYGGKAYSDVEKLLFCELQIF